MHYRESLADLLFLRTFLSTLLSELQLVGRFYFLVLKLQILGNFSRPRDRILHLHFAGGMREWREKCNCASPARSALHTPFPTGDPALFSQPNHKRLDSGSGLGAPPPSKRRSAAGAGAGPERGRSQARLHVPRPIRGGPGRELAGARQRDSPSYFPFFFLPRPTMT